MILAPAASSVSTFSRLTPPSTSISALFAVFSRSAFRSRTLSTVYGISFCPPKPGFTVMISTMSTLGSTYSMAESGVAGFNATPASMPFSFIASIVLSRCLHASAWTVMMSAPAAAKSSMYLTGSSIIRCTSNMRSVHFLIVFMTGSPIDMLGTKLPSITSICTYCAPASSSCLSCSPSIE